MKNCYADNGTITYGVDEITKVADFLRTLRGKCKIFTFVGSLGAGKTTLVRSLLKQCGVEGSITSPTFTYVNCYKNGQGEIFYHFDCYRIEILDDFIEAGFDEYLYQENSWCFIEWPELIVPLLDHAVCYITIDYISNEERVLSYRVV